MKHYRRVQQITKKIASYHVPIYAANASFYIILSVFPTIMLVVGILPFIGYSDADLIAAISGLVPSVLESLIERVIHDMSTNSTGTLISVTALAAVWSSSRGVYCIQLGLNAIHRVEESRSYLFRRILDMVYMIFVIIALVLTLVMHGFGQELAALCEKKNVPVLQLIARILQFRELIMFALLTVLFTAIFCVFPNCRCHIGEELPGAALAAFGWLLFTNGFSYYVRVFGAYSMLYGSLSIIPISMLWLFICLSILFYGKVFNLFLAERRMEQA